MTTFRVAVLPRAQQDIQEIYTFIAEVQQQPLVGQRWVDGIEEAIASLSHMPLRGKPLREQTFLMTDRELRQILYHNHRIIYAVTDDRVDVLHVRRGARADL